MSIPIIARNIRELPVGLLDDPELAMRDSFVDEAFDELKASIAENGIRIALIVRPRGDRFEVVAGHRRLAAARALHAVTVPCDVQDVADEDLEFVKVLENEDRAPVNAADAAAYFTRLFATKCGEDIDRVCALVRRERRYVEERILLFQGDEHVFAALKAGKISFGVAQEMNRIEDQNYRRMHLEQAEMYGMTIDAARQLRKGANFATSAKPPAGGAGVVVPGADATPTAPGNVCYICNRSDNSNRFRYVLVHEYCDMAIGQRTLAPFRESDSDTGTGDA